MEKDVKYEEICKKLGCEKICKKTSLSPADLSNTALVKSDDSEDPFSVLDVDELLYLIENDYI